MCEMYSRYIFIIYLINRLKRGILQPSFELPPVRPRCSTFTPSHSQLRQTGSAYKCISLSTMGWDYGEISCLDNRLSIFIVLEINYFSTIHLH